MVEDTAHMVIGENQSVYVPVGAQHRLENESDAQLVLIEVQKRAYLEADDIERFDGVHP